VVLSSGAARAGELHVCAAAFQCAPRGLHCQARRGLARRRPDRCRRGHPNDPGALPDHVGRDRAHVVGFELVREPFRVACRLPLARHHRGQDLALARGEALEALARAARRGGALGLLGAVRERVANARQHAVRLDRLVAEGMGIGH
jgi:hypothetical protein